MKTVRHILHRNRLQRSREHNGIPFSKTTRENTASKNCSEHGQSKTTMHTGNGRWWKEGPGTWPTQRRARIDKDLRNPGCDEPRHHGGTLHTSTVTTRLVLPTHTSLRHSRRLLAGRRRGLLSLHVHHLRLAVAAFLLLSEHTFHSDT